MSRDPLATTCAGGCLPGLSARPSHGSHGESNNIAGTALEWRKGVSEDLVGGDFAKWHIRKAVPKQAEDTFRASRDGAGLALLIGSAATEQRHSNDVGGNVIGKVIQGK